MSTFTPPGQTLEPVSRLDILVGQGWGIRALARVIDFVLIFAVSYAAGLVAGFLIAIVFVGSGAETAGLAQRLGQPDLLSYVFSFLASVSYFVVCQTAHGSTLGKQICGLVVVREDGTPAGFGSNILRELGYFVDALFFGVVAYAFMSKTPLKQRVGDKWGHTVVARRADIRPEHLSGVGSFIGALVMACSLVGLLGAFIPTVLKLI